VRLSYRDEKVIMGMGKLCSKTQVQGIYSTHRTATERENLKIWARDSLVMRRGVLRHRERERHGACCRDSILYRLVLAYFMAHDHWASQHNITIMYPGHFPALT
jgi:hypothetical protein